MSERTWILPILAFGLLAPDAAYQRSLPLDSAVVWRHFPRQPTSRPAVTRVRLLVPHEDAEVTANERLLPGTGTIRDLVLPAGSAPITVRVTWRPNTYTTMTRSATVVVDSAPLTIDLTAARDTDHADVRYVPTPTYVVREMIELAGLRPDDVVFEPGCGDARVLIAALKAGAKRGVGIDLDPERVSESAANVHAAGFDGRIEIRHGDALSTPDIASATVVFLYMGDEFNHLIKPLLQRHLRPGARIVSHRFLMGDWAPDKTVTIPDETGTAAVHLWTIKPEGIAVVPGRPSQR